MHLPTAIVAALWAATSYSHPRHDISKELAERRAFLESHTNSLDHCASMHRASGFNDRAIRRRFEHANSIKKRNLQGRQASSVNKSHKSDKPFNASTSHALVFAGKKSCVLTPETTEGPFYVMGESVRSDIVEGEKGVPLHIDFQVVDVNTCEPIKGIFLELWNVNSTGVYSGALAIPNGSGMGDKANLDRTFLRGAQMTDNDGVVQFETIFPGHYTGRATHVHLTTHLNAKAEANNTIWHTTATHAGQLFFDQDLVNDVEKTAPYSTNRQQFMRNAADNILQQELPTADPFLEYVRLGDSLSDGVFAWYTLGVNTSFSRPIMAVAMKGKDGGKMVTTNPKVPGLDQIFPGGFPTAYQPAYGAPAAPTGARGGRP